MLYQSHLVYKATIPVEPISLQDLQIHCQRATRGSTVVYLNKLNTYDGKGGDVQ